jgi:hypothetical protein
VGQLPNTLQYKTGAADVQLRNFECLKAKAQQRSAEGQKSTNNHLNTHLLHMCMTGKMLYNIVQ